MKIRNGFVSNSSSSSFLVGYGEIRSKTLFDKWIKELGLTLKSREDFDLNQDGLIEDSYVRGCYSGNCGVVLIGEELHLNKFNAIDSFSKSIKIDLDKVKEDRCYYIFNFMGNEGDCGYLGTLCINDDYDSFSFEDLEDHEQKIYSAVMSNNEIFNTDMSDAAYGAGRNG